MRMTLTFAMNQIISHGFGLFLFAALVPMMQADVAITSWHLASAGALTQVSYLVGAMVLGSVGHKVDSGRLMLGTGVLSTSLLFCMAFMSDPTLILVLLTVMSASAAISWGGIVELVTRHGDKQSQSTSLSVAASGTAWGYGFNGLLILMVVPVLGWRSGWIAAGVLGLITLLATWHLLRGLAARNNAAATPLTTAAIETGVVAEMSVAELPAMADVPANEALSFSQLLKTVLKERVALLASVTLFVVGFASMPFSTWMNSWLAELNLPAALGGYTWMVIGISGMVAGFAVGKLADRRGHGVAMLSIALVFAAGMLAFVFDPARFALLVGFCYGMLYFPIWGVVAGWVGQHYSSRATMQINGIGMVMFGAGGASGNVLAGVIQQLTGSLAGLYWMIAAVSVLLLVLSAVIWASSRVATEVVGGMGSAAVVQNPVNSSVEP